MENPPFTIHEPKDTARSPLFIEAPHTSKEGAPLEHRDRHTGSDLGSLNLLMNFHRRFRRAAAISSERSRRLVEHNRTEDCCLKDCDPKDMDEEERARRLAEDYRPYVEAAYGQIKTRYIDRGRLPLLLCLHTYAYILYGSGLHPLMNGKIRKSFLGGNRRYVFNVAGDEKSVFVNVLGAHLRTEFLMAYRRGWLKGIPSLLAGDVRDPVSINGIFNQNKVLPYRKPNPDLEKVMSPRYPEGPEGENWNFPYVSLETRQDLVANPRIQEIYFWAIKKTVTDPRVLRDLREREDAFFNRAGRNLPRISRNGLEASPTGAY